MQRLVMAAVFGILVAAAPAAAQDEKPVDVNFGFGWAIPAGDFKNSFDTGWNGTFAATFNISPTVGVQGEYMYERMDGPARTITVSPTPVLGAGSAQLLESNHQVHAFTGNVVFKSNSRARLIGGYVLAGAGLYHRIVQITSPAVGYTTFCDPYWYVCYPAAVAVDNIIGDRSSDDFGMNFGGGVTFGKEVKFYVEARYHYVWGPEISSNGSQLPASTTSTANRSTNAQYFPITFGIRF
jgi:outer membrane protein with beta-barrel domain